MPVDCIKAEEAPKEAIRDRFSYDAETGVIINIVTGRQCGYDARGYLIVNVNIAGRNCHIRLHRLAWFLHHGEWPDGELDHINQDRKDNRIANLRISDRRQQGRNSRRRTLPPGVWFQPTGSWEKPFEARCFVAGSYVYLGRFTTIAEAAARVAEFEIRERDAA